VSSADLGDHRESILGRIACQSQLRQRHRERPEHLHVAGQRQRRGAIVRLAQAAEAETCVRIGRRDGRDPPPLRQFIPSTQSVVGPIEQRRQRRRRARGIREQHAHER
jgi:hypothetical protein